VRKEQSGQIPVEDSPNPLDPKNPAYNPETGSTPAMR